MDTRISSRTSVVVAIIAAVLAVLSAPAAAAPPGDITEYPLPNYSQPGDIAAGPDGNLWFTELYAVGRITPTGSITEYPLPKYETPGGIAAGPDGNLWFTEEGNQIGRITPGGTITEYPLPADSHCPTDIAAGPDGNLWFTEGCTSGFVGGGLINKIGRITPGGTITEYPLPTADSYPFGIAAGPDGNLWFTELVGNKIGRITPTGTITEYPLPKANSHPVAIAAGPDGNLWFTEDEAIGRITPRGRITEYPIPPTAGKTLAAPGAIAAGPDGNMWFTDPYSNMIGRITPAGSITEYPLPASPSDIAAGPDGNLWFTEPYANRIGRISPTATPAAVKWICPVNVTLHRPPPSKVGNRILTDKIATNTSTCVLRKPVVLCRPLASSTAGEQTFCDTKVTRRGTIRVNTQGYGSVRVTVIVRAKPKPGHADSWKPDTWRKSWLLR